MVIWLELAFMVVYFNVQGHLLISTGLPLEYRIARHVSPTYICNCDSTGRITWQAQATYVW